MAIALGISGQTRRQTFEHRITDEQDAMSSSIDRHRRSHNRHGVGSITDSGG